MKTAFRLVCSEGASFLTKEKRQQLATEAVRTDERMIPKEAAYILNDDRGLKIVARWTKFEMTDREATDGGLPSGSDN